MIRIVLLSCAAISMVSGQCQIPGDSKCFNGVSTPIGPTGDPCCTGSLCKPWLEAGQSLSNPVDWYCQWSDPIPVNGLCGNKQGTCADGLNCVDGKCSDQPTTTTPATDDTTTSAATEDSTTTASSEAETTEMCEAQAGELCENTQYNIVKTCCSPYTCTKQTDISSICKGDNLPLGATCFSSLGSLGTCESPNICLNNVCTAKDTSCIQPVNGLCYSADVNQQLGTCCSGSFPAPVEGTKDMFCQAVLDAGSDCNQAEHRGFCKTGSYCIEGICKAAADTTTSTTTSTSTTSTSTTSTSTTSTVTTTTEACIDPDALCVAFSGDGGGTCCNGVSDCTVFDPPNGYKCVKNE